jgi:hypothetical protein
MIMNQFASETHLHEDIGMFELQEFPVMPATLLQIEISVLQMDTKSNMI